jgi:peptidoglycan/xylan/chitin deacetylase (PgdA/CDA1 family)
MKYYWVKTHWLVKRLFGNYIWDLPPRGKTVYLTFDDGPTPQITNWVLERLEAHGAKATFFCIGNNISKNRAIFDRILLAGHAVGNHTFDHLNGWHVADGRYFESVTRCAQAMAESNAQSLLFRPPYGKLKKTQSRHLRSLGYRIVMWDVLSADFDRAISPEKCLRNVIKNIRPGSIVIFHDSEKAFGNLEYALPKTLEFLSENGFRCEAIRN